MPVRLSKAEAQELFDAVHECRISLTACGCRTCISKAKDAPHFEDEPGLKAGKAAIAAVFAKWRGRVLAALAKHPPVPVKKSLLGRIAKAWDESKHPRNPKGATGGGEFASQTTTPEFKAWFGDWQDPHAWSSKRDPSLPPVSVVMKDGKPLELFHATKGDFSTFEVGRKSINNYGFFGNFETQRSAIFATENPKFAQEYINPEEPGTNVMPVYMNIKSPLDLRNGFDEDTLDELKGAGLNPSYYRNASNYWEFFDDKDGAEFVGVLKKLGYDGAIFYEDSKSGFATTYAAFDPEQVKSAIGNRGTFDPKEKDITKSLLARVWKTFTRIAKDDPDDDDLPDPEEFEFDIEAILQDAFPDAGEDAIAELADALMITQSAGVDDGIAIAADELEIDEDTLASAVKEPLEDALQEYAMKFSESTLSRIDSSIKDLLVDGLSDGIPTKEMGGIINDRFQDLTGYESDRIARTEFARGQVRAALASYQNDGISLARWLGTPDECPICDGFDGRVWAISDIQDAFPAHPNCILPSNKAIIPDLVAASKVFYVGPAVEIHLANGRRLSCTANHMVLTPTGYRQAKSLNEGEYVLVTTDSEGMAGGYGIDHYNGPTAVEDIFEALAVKGAVTIPNGTLAATDFYGDARFFNSDVNIVLVNRLLLRNRKASIPQSGSKRSLNIGDMGLVALSALGNMDKFNVSSLSAGIGGVSSSGNPLALPRTPLDILQKLRFTGGADSHSNASETDVHCSLGDTRRASEFCGRFASFIAPAKISKIRNFSVSTHVYDFQASQYHLYQCESFLVKNCRCAVEAVYELGPDEEVETEPPTNVFTDPDLARNPWPTLAEEKASAAQSDDGGEVLDTGEAEDVGKANPNHDARGRFAAGDAKGRDISTSSDSLEPGQQVKRDLTNTPEFKQWFGDSKVVTPDGKPLVVYHGSRAAFSEFKTDATDNVSLFNTQVGSHFAVDPSVPNAFTAGEYAYAQDFHVNEYHPDESWYRGKDGEIKYDGLPVLVKQDKDLHDIAVEPYDVNKHGSTWGMRDRLGPDYSVRMLIPGGAVYPVYLSIKHPLNVGTEDTGFDQNAITRAVEKVVFPADKNLFIKAVTYNSTDPAKIQHYGEVWDALQSGKGFHNSGGKYGNWESWDEFAKDYGIGLLDRHTAKAKDILVKLGYDGIHYQNTSRNEVQPGHSGDTWIAFHPSQIKSVFNPTPHADSPDISKAWEEDEHPRDDRGEFAPKFQDPEVQAAAIKVAGMTKTQFDNDPINERTTELIHKLVAEETGTTDPAKAVAFYVKKFGIQTPTKFVWHDTSTRHGEISVQYDKATNKPLQFVIGLPRPEPWQGKVKERQLSTIRHEIEHALDIEKRGYDFTKPDPTNKQLQITHGLPGETTAQAVRRGSRGHHAAYDYFELDYLWDRLHGKDTDLTTPLAKRDATKLSASCVMAMVEPEDAKPFLEYGKSIPDSELYTEPAADDSYGPDFGRETDIHATVLYGLDTQDPADVRAITDKFEPFTIVCGRTASFPQREGKEYRVLYVPVYGGALTRMNKRLKRLPYKSDFDGQYIGHMTIAYLKPEFVDKYVGDDRFAGKAIPISHLDFSTPTGVHTEIPLTKEA